MAAKLKSISKQIHWSSLVRAAIFACAWWYLPAWLFFHRGIGLYFFAAVRIAGEHMPFLVLLGISLTTPPALSWR